ncbi:integrase domain-containing protein [Oceanicoccus sagamiensis]|uniref:Integrase n=1 Tax=Oceanicoccus sagamiensis TaxID=716816 RepID=A0A1X9NCP1_9GAMM|nr:integrase domain-containing protein [Oceanicoccus sagamiensis]ARN73299.1 integrase [Oceanicoccus sagamiensis]
MANVTTPLTNTEVKQSKPKDKEYNLADGGGLALRVKPIGSKLWLFNYTHPQTRKRANISLGVYPAVSLAAARKLAGEYRELLTQKIDPKSQRDASALAEQEAHSRTLKHVAEQWFDVKKTTVTPNYSEDIWRSLELHIFPKLGKKPIHNLTAPDAIHTLKPLAAKGSLETVKRLGQRLNEIMTYAVNTGQIAANPLAGIKSAFQAPEKNNLPALMPDELPELMRALTIGSIKITTRCLIEWQLHTMVRPSEAAGTCWNEIDFNKALWFIPAERMKKKRPHTVPLSQQAIALLETMRPISGHREHVFPADRNPKSHIHQQTANMALKRMGFGGRLVAHGMRSVASTTLNEKGFDADVIEAALAHVDSNEVRAAYNRAEYLQRRTKMMEWWSSHIDQAASGNMSLAAGTKTLRKVN